jgi:hypothetical protein
MQTGRYMQYLLSFSAACILVRAVDLFFFFCLPDPLGSAIFRGYGGEISTSLLCPCGLSFLSFFEVNGYWNSL